MTREAIADPQHFARGRWQRQRRKDPHNGMRHGRIHTTTLDEVEPHPIARQWHAEQSVAANHLRSEAQPLHFARARHRRCEKDARTAGTARTGM